MRSSSETSTREALRIGLVVLAVAWAVLTLAVVAGADMIAFSLFGLLLGLATMGVAGALLLLAGTMSRRG